jgi:hypothetical protein
MRTRERFRSYFMGGFECSSQRRNDGRRLDMLQATGHDVHAESDYLALQAHGIRTVRDGIRWHLIEKSPGQYDWSSVAPMAQAARRTGTQVIWDLCHYGWPDDLDIWSEDFPIRFARYGAAAAVYLTETFGEPPWLCPLNEMSYIAWAGAEVGRFLPSTIGRGSELKRQLARANIAAVRAIRRAVSETRFICAEPLIRVIAGSDPQTAAAAKEYTEAQYEALNMVLGVSAPELGGNPSFIDVIGVNFYPDNQWTFDGHTLFFGHHDWKSLTDLLIDVTNRYGKPILISETSAEGGARAPWLHYVAQEAAQAQRAGVDVMGICLYPVLDYPGWENDRLCPVGLLTGGGAFRAVDLPLAQELHRLDQLRVRETPFRQSAIAFR